MTAWVKPPPHILVTDETTRAELEEAMRHVRASQKRAPQAMQERYSARLDALLAEWMRAAG